MSAREVSCTRCVLTRVALRQAIYRANDEVMRNGKADTGDVKKLKDEALSCPTCGGSGWLPGSPNSRRSIRRDVAPLPTPRVKPAKPAPLIDQEAVRAVLEPAALAARVAASTSRGTRLPAIGECHTCGRAVTGERRYCGPCAARR